MLFTPLGQRIIVRFARKPIWMPVAPSKLFRIYEHNFYNEEEVKQIKKLKFAYTAQMSSIHKFMEKEFYIPATQSGGLPADFVEKEKEEDRLIFEENDKINSEVAKQREEYFDKWMKSMEEKVMEAKLDREQVLIEAADRVDEFVKKHKTDPDSCVTPDNLDAMIEKAIETPISFEFCIDRQGRRHGQTASPKDKKASQMN